MENLSKYIMRYWCHGLLITSLLSIIGPLSAQVNKSISGVVRSYPEKIPIANATLHLSNSLVTQTNEKGEFKFTYDTDSGTLVVRHILFEDEVVYLNVSRTVLDIVMRKKINEIEEVSVVSTGYYTLPKERVTGSFEVLDGRKLNQSLSGNLLERLEGATGALSFDRRIPSPREGTDQRLSLRLRGLSTIMSNTQPLIILDNFPFEGDLRDINPTDIESVVFLKDAASSAIWGAQSGNGVIVIQRKRASQNHPKSLQLSLSQRIGSKPDLFNTDYFISPDDFLSLESQMFDRNFYAQSNLSFLSPYVHLLFQRQSGLIDESTFESIQERFSSTDLRKDAEHYLYQHSIDNSASIAINGGGDSHGYLLTGGFDNGRDILVGNKDKRYSFRFDNSITILPNLSLQLTGDYVFRQEIRNAVSMHDQSGIVPADKLMMYPYASLNDQGSPARFPIAFSPAYIEQFEESTGRSWSFAPLEELSMRDNQDMHRRWGMVALLKYSLPSGLSVSGQYINNWSSGMKLNYYNKDQYYARNLINRFMQPNGTFVIPDGDIRHMQSNGSANHAGRVQLDLNRSFGEGLDVNALAGAEISEYRSTFEPLQVIYGFNKDNFIGQTVFDHTNYYSVRPEGTQRIPASASQIYETTDRFISYYGLASAVWQKRYILSSSLRWDASNLFGVKTNQKGVPLWSLGSTWVLTNEPFMEDISVGEVRIRATVGENGNVNKSATAFPTATFTTGNRTGLREALLRTAGNPQLKWERTKTKNFGLDWSSRDGFLGASVDFFKKDSYDLLGNDVLDPTTGINPINSGVKQIVNYGKFNNEGVDLQVFLRRVRLGNVNARMDMRLSKNWNKVVDYNVATTSVLDYFQYIVPAVQGVSRDVLYAYPWYGLDAHTGDPLVWDGSQLTNAYGSNVSGFEYEDLIQSGSSFPLWNGSFGTEFSYANLSVNFLFTWKGAYKFRRSSVNYQNLIRGWSMHVDYNNRWQKPGDELYTNVPSVPDVLDSNRDSYYSNSELLVEDGDHIRLHSINLNYRLSFIKSIQLDLTGVAENLGIIWRKNSLGLDPEYHLNYYLPPKQFSLGLRATIN